MNKTLVGIILVILVAFFRLFPHPANFTPTLAIFIFSFGFFNNKWVSAFTALSALFVSDLLINNLIYSEYFNGFVIFYSGAIWTYLAVVVASVPAIFFLKKFVLKNLIISSLVVSILFFVFSNFGVWVTGFMYPKTIGGLIACYSMALPFFRNTVIATLLYASIMYGIIYLYKIKFSIDINQ